MEVSLRKYCTVVNHFYQTWESHYNQAVEHFNNCLKQIDEHLYCGYVDYNEVYHGYNFPICASYVSLFSTHASFSSCNLIISRNKNIGLVNHGYAKYVLNLPDPDEIFHNCYDAINAIYDLLDQFSDFSLLVRPMILLDDIWLLNHFSRYGYQFSISADSYGFQRKIDFSQDNGWNPVFKRYDHDDAINARAALNQFFDTCKVDVSNMDEYFQEPKIKKKKPWYTRIFG